MVVDLAGRATSTKQTLTRRNNNYDGGSLKRFVVERADHSQQPDSQSAYEILLTYQSPVYTIVY